MSISINNAQKAENIDGTTLTLSSYVVGSESDRILVVSVVNFRQTNDRTFTSVVFNGSENLTRAVGRSVGNFGFFWRSEIWYLLDPSNATGDIVVTVNGDVHGLGIVACYLSGAKQQAPEATASSDDRTSPYTVSVTTVTDDAMIVRGAIMAPLTANTTTVAASGQTMWGWQIIDPTNFENGHGMGWELKATAGAEDGGFTHDGTGGDISDPNVATAWARGAETTAQSFDATASGTVTLTTANIFTRTLAVVMAAGVAMSQASIFARALAVTMTAAIVMNKTALHARTLAATAAGAPVLTRALDLFRALDATAVGAATMNAKQVILKAMNATAIGVATFSTTICRAVSLVAATLATATLTRLNTFKVSLDVIMQAGLAFFANDLDATILKGRAGWSQLFTNKRAGGEGMFRFRR